MSDRARGGWLRAQRGRQRRVGYRVEELLSAEPASESPG